MIKLFSLAVSFVGFAIIAWAQPSAKFTSDTTKGCAPVTIKYSANDTASNLTYLWVFGNGNVSTLPNPRAIYYKPGKYEVSLTVTNASGKKSTETISNYIHVFKNPVANFDGGPFSGCIPLSSGFTNKSTPGDGKITGFIWDFGDGNTSKDSIGNHVYKAEGEFNVSLAIKDENQCEDKKLIPKYAKALPSPIPSISADKQYYCEAPLTVNFTNTTGGLQSSDKYLWEFGDGSTSTAKNPTHTFNSTGKFDVTLRITKANGCSGITTFPGYIVIDELKPEFVADQVQACAPTEIKFTNITQPSRKGVTFQWNFGDGSISNSPEDAYHEYTQSGNYNVTLTANVNGACKASVTLSKYIKIDKSPVAKFTLSDTIACKIPSTITLKNESENSTSAEWFVDGKSIGSQTFTAYTFTKFGNYEIRLVAENFIGCTDTSKVIFKIEKPEVTITPSVMQGCVPTPITFERSAKSFDEIKDYFWTFEKGSRSKNNDSPVEHTFYKEGTYEVILDIVTKSGCKASDTVTIDIGLKTDPDFEITKDTFCNNERDTFINITAGKIPIHSWDWKLDTSTFSDKKNGVLITKNPPGTYDIVLISENNGCFDTLIKPQMITILAPLAKLLEEENGNCDADTLVRKNNSVGEDSFQWSVFYPTGSIREKRNEEEVSFTKEYDKHKLLLTAYNSTTGCIDTSLVTLNFPEVSTQASISMLGTLCAPSKLQFSTNDDNIHSYFWFTENDTLFGPEQVLEYPAPGEYSIRLIIQNPDNNCVDSTDHKFTVTGPDVSGELIGKEGCGPVSIQLKNNSDPKDFSSLYWLIDTLKIPISSVGTINHTLTKPGPETDGSYNIKLIGKDENTCAGYQSFPIKVKGIIGADIKVRKITSCAGRKFIFQAIAPNRDLDQLKIEWDFGDGTTSTEAIHNLEFEKDDVYNLVLKLTDSDGCVTQVNKVIDIAKEKLFPKFTADSLESDCPPLFVKFRDLSTTSPGRMITSWLWDFGDGTTSIERNPSKLYLSPGKFSVKLYLEDENKCRDTVVYEDFVVVSGPEGNYDFDKKQGCVPLDVNFTGTQKGAVKSEFDMGDGTVYKDKLNFTHTYKIPGRYIPVMVLTDSFGCTYTHPPIDTIYVYDYPKPSFVKEGVCFGKPISFTAVNGVNDGEINKYKWEFIQGTHVQTSDEANPTVTFKNNIKPIIKLTTTNEVGCSGTFEGEADLSLLLADFEPVSTSNCVGNNIQLKSTVTSDTNVTSYKWTIGNKTFNGESISYSADSIGPQEITLVVTNEMNCVDTLQTQKLVIGDTIPPLNVDILRVTVNDDETVQLDLKPSIAKDFDSYVIYKDGINGFKKIQSEKDRLKTTFIETGNNTLSDVYCYRAELKNTCGVLSDSFKSIPHCTVESKAVGEVNRAVVSWNKYEGWNQISGYQVLREELDNPGVYFPLGVTDKDETTFIDSNIVCRVEHTYKIKAIEQSGNFQISFSDTCKAKPIWDVVLDPNELIRASVVDDEFVTIDWDSVYNPRIPVRSYILQRSDDGENIDFTWKFEADEFGFEDKKVKVDDQSYFYRTYAIDQCDDTSDFLNFGKTILLTADTTNDQRPLLKWSTYQGWDAGVDFYHVEIKNEDGSFSFIGKTSSTDSMLVDDITNLNQRPDYCYRIVGYRNTVEDKPQVVSISNEDCSPVYSRLYYPNAFSPNSDVLNENFGTPGIYIRDYHMSIYSRWGELVFETYDMDEKWDGTYNGKPCQMGAYAVIVESTGVDLIKRKHFGTVTLLR